MRRSFPFFIMGILWLVLIVGLGLGFLLNRQDLRRRQQLGEGLVSHYEIGVPLAHGRDREAASVACERAARGNPADPAVWSVWALVQAQGVLLQGDDPAEWSRIHRVASQLLGREWAGADARTRIRLLASRVLVRAATADTRAELTDNFHEALRFWNLWPRSSLLRNATLWAGVAAGQSAFVGDRLPGPGQPLDWPLLLDWHLSRQQFGAVAEILDLWAKHEPGHAMLPLWRAWIACRRGEKTAPPPAGADLEPPGPRAWRQLVRACVTADRPALAIAELEKVPLVPQDAVLLAVMRLAQELGAEHLYMQVKKEFSLRRGSPDGRIERLDATERMNRLDPEPAFAWFSLQKTATIDDTAVWSALLSGAPAVARQWAASLKGATWPQAAFSSDFTEEDLNELDRHSRGKLHSVWWSMLWARAAVTSLDNLEWGTAAHEHRLKAIRARLSKLPADSPFTTRLAARINFELDRFSEAGLALARLCGVEGARPGDDPGPCRALRGPGAEVELFARFLTCEEGRSVDYAVVRERLERILPMLIPTGHPMSAGLFWQLRLLRLTLRAQPGQSRLVEERLKALPSPPPTADPETLTEAALVHLYLGKAEAARTLLARLPVMPVRSARRLAHHYLTLQDPASALRVLDPVLARGDLAPRVRQNLRLLHAQARLLLKQDVCGEYEELFLFDPCPEMALATARAYLARGRRADCPRLHELISGSGEKTAELTSTAAGITAFCAGPDR